MPMKTDLNSLKKELSKLTDVKYLKKEINRIAEEIRKDVNNNLTPQARERFKQLETRFRDVMKTLNDLQKQVDSNLEKIVDAVRDKTGTGSTKKRRSGKSSSSKKSAARKTTKKAGAKTSQKKKTAKKASSRKSS